MTGSCKGLFTIDFCCVISLYDICCDFPKIAGKLHLNLNMLKPM